MRDGLLIYWLHLIWGEFIESTSAVEVMITILVGTTAGLHTKRIVHVLMDGAVKADATNASS